MCVVMFRGPFILQTKYLSWLLSMEQGDSPVVHLKTSKRRILDSDDESSTHCNLEHAVASATEVGLVAYTALL